MLIDRAIIYVRSGKGGAGCISFRREKYVPKGGPDGGDGGDGGHVILVGDRSLSTLLPVTPRPHYRAGHGQPGMGKSMHGADGANTVVPVPPGTLVYNADTDDLLIDINAHGDEYVAARGGRGGLGNEHFKSPTNQAPREATPGEPYVEYRLRLELKLIADVGLIGLPNAGKSTMLRAISRAEPKVADYPFTTLKPHLGIAELPSARGDSRRLVVADIPGLIEGAAGGAGLGHDFLRHVERTKVLVHVLDIAPIDGSDPVSNYEMIRRELHEYSPALAEKPELIVLNKVDLILDEEQESVINRIAGRLGMDKGERPFVSSGATGQGTTEVLEACWQHVDEAPSTGWRAQDTAGD